MIRAFIQFVLDATRPPSPGSAPKKPAKKLTRLRTYSDDIREAWRVLRLIQTFTGDGAEGRAINYLKEIDWRVFEHLIANRARQLGWRVKRGVYYKDGGFDGELVRDDGKAVLVQAKRYRGHVKTRQIVEFADLCERKGQLGWFVHCGKTPKAGLKIGHNLEHIDIISGDRLLEYLLGDGERRAA